MTDRIDDDVLLRLLAILAPLPVAEQLRVATSVATAALSKQGGVALDVGFQAANGDVLYLLMARGEPAGELQRAGESFKREMSARYESADFVGADAEASDGH